MFTDERVDRESQEKLYVQMCSIIRGKIEKGEWTSGAQIPTEDELCRTYDVSKATVRIAIAELARDGYLKKWQGKGTFVGNPGPCLGMAMKTRLTEDMFGEGVLPRKEVVERRVMEPAEEVMNTLRYTGEVYYILGKRLVGDEPACLDESFVPLDMMPGLEDDDVSDCSFYDLVQRKAVKRVTRVMQNVEVTEVAGEKAAMLGVVDGTSVLLVHRLFISQEGRPIAYTRLFGSGRKYMIQTEFDRIR
ncbi:MAG: GntR family transcriptional regulator [Nitrospirae bacterium]|nr:GntR family transcriptional regulator [Nitrospirota bacterium]MBI5696290.1 GntR family transcriptional regulator [Nitrospirota bacterium]